MTLLKLALTFMCAVCIAPASAGPAKVTPATAAALDEIRKQTHYSMELSGWIDVDEVGAVTAHGLDQEVATLPPAVVTLVEQAASGWRFAARESGESPATGRMPIRLRVEARRGADGYISGQRIAYAQFGELPAEERVTFAQQPKSRARYHDEAYRANVSGAVHLAIRVGRDGKPIQVFAEQVDLTVVDTEAGMERWRKVLAEMGVRIAQRWRFNPPSAGPSASRQDWTIQVPIRFVVNPQPPPSPPGQWDLYVPGPKYEIPWDAGDRGGIAGDVVGMPGDADWTGARLRLLTSLNPSPAS